MGGKETKPKQQHQGHRQRMRDRILKHGADTLQDYELLEALLFFSNPRIDTKPMAKSLLEKHKSLGALLVADHQKLTETDGVGEQTLTLFMLIRAATRKISEGTIIGHQVLNSWEKVIDFCRTQIGYGDVECFLAIYLDSTNTLIEHEVLSVGTLDRVTVYPREILKSTIRHHASSVLLVHNHPSGLTRPSKQDIVMTQRISEALQTIDVRLHDHLIISPSEHFSFKNDGLI